ncbi:MAG: LamG domain-containing protein [Candidatus Micrarchaeales archaeon]|nr:LamG domain-containing protein [Candidatus Micrarchaeales archaeon]
MKTNDSSRNRSGIQRSRKGIMLTLLVIIVFVLMLSEITAYIVININFNQLAQLSSAESNQGSTAKLISASASVLLQASLSKAVAVLSNFEASPQARQSLFQNDTAGALESLMEYGMLGAHDFRSSMGTALISNLSAMVNARLGPEGAEFAIKNSNLSVFDGSASTINASYTALAVINASSGTFTYPIFASASIQLNGTVDLSGVESAQPSYISILKRLPSAIVLGGTAMEASTSPYSFAYGTAVSIAGTPQCSSIPSQLYSENMILVTPDASNIPNTLCGMGGVVTNVINTSILKPYLVYAAGGVFNSVINGTQVLLDGKGKVLLDVSPLQSVIVNGSYMPSQMLPSYLDRADAGVTHSIGNGLFSFNLLHRSAPHFSNNGGASTSNMLSQRDIPIGSEFSVSFWFNKNEDSLHCGDILSGAGGGFSVQALTGTTPFTYCSSTSQYGMPLRLSYVGSDGNSYYNIFPSYLPTDTWIQGAFVFGANTLALYIDGQLVSSSSGIINPAPSSNALIIGSGLESFNGSVSDVQVYNAPLSGADVQALYLEGISGIPVGGENLTAWYPLNGNANDYSGNNFNGTLNNAGFTALNGYYGDPIYAHTFTDFNSSVVAGILNCNNLDQCSDSSQHLYLQNLPLTPSSNESAALGLPYAVLPMALGFSGGAGSFVQQKSAIPWLATPTPQFSLSIWIYPKSSDGVVIDENNNSQGFDNSALELYGGNAYMSDGNPSSCQAIGPVPVDQWTNIVLTYSGSGNMQGYVNGAEQASLSGTFNAPTNAVYYNLGQSATQNCGSGAPYSGLMADYQVYNTQLSPTQVAQLYLNDTLAGVPANIVMPLGIESAGMQNTTAETVGGNYGLFENSAGVCSAANVIGMQCGLYYTPP